MAPVPDVRTCVAEQKAWRLGRELVWHERCLVLTDDALYILSTHPLLSADAVVKEYISLAELASVEYINFMTHLDEHKSSAHSESPLDDRDKIFGGTTMVREDALAWLQLQDSSPHGLVLKIGNELDYNKTLVLRMQDEAACEAWVKSATNQLQAFRRKVRRAQQSWWRRAQNHVHAFYHSNPSQVVIALMISMNFIINVAEAELGEALEAGSPVTAAFYICDLMFASFFALELCVNIVAHWFWAFVSDAWCWIDLAVVVSAIVTLVLGEVDGVSTLRLLKAFRVVRLLGKLVSLRRIISAVSSAFAPVCNAFFVMALVLFLFSMVGVDLFKDVSPDKFGCFSKACFTMFQGRSSFLPACLPASLPVFILGTAVAPGPWRVHMCVARVCGCSGDRC